MTGGLPLFSVLVDEIGIETVSHGHFRIVAEYRPVFRRERDCLRIAAFDGFCAVYGEGRRDRFPDRDGTPAGNFAELFQRLQLANFHYLSPQDTRLIVDHDPGEGRSLLRAASYARDRAESVGEAGLRLSQIICRVSSSHRAEGLEALRAAGVAIMFDVFCPETVDGNWRVNPDIVEIPALWFTKIAREPAAAKLLHPLVDAYRREGIEVMITGVSTENELRAAIDANSDYLSGSYLAEAKPAAAMVDEEPLAIDTLLGASDEKRFKLALIR